MDTLSFTIPRMRGIKKIHFVGIGGAGMCGIAEILHKEGYIVTGSDQVDNKAIQYLKMLGITIYIGHNEKHVGDTQVIVRSSAISDTNPEIVFAKQILIPIIPRAVMLAELMRFRYGIAISGTHGKTTTTSLMSSLLLEGGLDPSFVIGGKLNNFPSHAKLGLSSYLVVEADESDASFLFLKPLIAVVTNIDTDHMSTYENDFEKLRETFLKFLHQLPFHGLAVLCGDDPEIKKLIPLLKCHFLTYGFNSDVDFQAYNWRQEGLKSYFNIKRPFPHTDLMLCSYLPGKHNVLNALATVAVATEIGITDNAIINGLLKFQGVGRRFQILGEKQFSHGKALLVDDYGHHPREIQSTIEALRQVWPSRRLIHAFQPHRYTRTQELHADFVKALSLADELLLLDIYSAGELAIPGVCSQMLANDISQLSKSVTLVSEVTLETTLDNVVKTDDIVLIQGAGSIGQFAINLIK